MIKYSQKNINFSDKENVPVLILHLYKIGNKVFCQTIGKAKPNFKYIGNIPENFRPKNLFYIVGQISSGENLSTRTLYINSDGTIETKYAYDDSMFTAFSVWETN